MLIIENKLMKWLWINKILKAIYLEAIYLENNLNDEKNFIDNGLTSDMMCLLKNINSL